MNGEILETMALQCDCFISSLKSKLYMTPLFAVLSFWAVFVRECSYSLSYLFAQDLHFDSVEEIHVFLKKQYRL